MLNPRLHNSTLTALLLGVVILILHMRPRLFIQSTLKPWDGSQGSTEKQDRCGPERGVGSQLRACRDGGAVGGRIHWLVRSPSSELGHQPKFTEFANCMAVIQTPSNLEAYSYIFLLQDDIEDINL